MKRALRLARKGKGKTSPNPLVGAVVVKKGVVVGEGVHPGPGQPHAEALALAQAGKRAAGATLYINLEPCCHTNKRTPPCVDAILRSGVRKVVAAMIDPNPLVSGKGFEALRRGGLEVGEDLLRSEAERLNEIYIKYITTGRPFVILKTAMTLDGRIATAKGESRWVTGEAARREVHRLRSEVDAVMVGIGTVLADNPMLTPRIKGAKNPLRVIVDPRLKTPLHARAISTLSDAPTLLVTTAEAPSQRIKEFRKKGAQVEIFPQIDGKIGFPAILERLGKSGIASVLIEGGGTLNGMALRAGVVDRAIFFIAPKLLLGDDAKSVIAGRSIERLSEALRLVNLKVRRIGEDIRVEGDIQKSAGGGGFE